MATKKITRLNVNGVEYDANMTTLGHLVTPNGRSEYVLMVDNEGNLFAYNDGNIPSPGTAPTASGQTLPKVYINSFYCGGKDANEHTLNYCSHNFVELSNLTNSDINLSGLSLQYAIDGTDWAVLPLSGVIRKGSTFVVRGAQCSVLSSPTTKIKVDKYDLEWRNAEGNLIAFDAGTSAKFYLAFNLSKYGNENPYNPSGKNAASDAIGYIDLVGIKGISDPGGYEGTGSADGKGPYFAGGGLSNTKLFRKYYAMDPVKQATKAIGSRVNANDWCYIDLTKDDGELIPSIEVYRPMAVSEKKNLFYNKTKPFADKPSVITCTFGRQATDGGAAKRATRCFNWLTTSLDNKYIWIRTLGSSTWDIVDGAESFSAGTYARIIKEYTNDTVIIANKFIISGLSAGEYEYTAGSKAADGTPDTEHCTKIHKFKVRTDTEVNQGFSFVQTSDQQGFNWEEYRVWDAAAKTIEKESGSSIQFMINTGDMTQNGNRLGEWLDYFNLDTDYFRDMEEQATIGNNDLSLNVLYMLGNGEDNNKLWLENITFFYTFELDPDNMPIFTGYTGNEYLIPSLYSFNYGKVHFLSVNTEIKNTAEESEYGFNFGSGHWGIFYPQIKQWCERDIAPYQNDSSIWKIVFCHEMPFTILTPKVAETTGKVNKVRSGGSNANDNNPADNVFWLSEFCQTHGVKLCIGGHKHTEASTWQLLENVSYDGDVRTVDSMHPIIVLNNDPNSPFYIGKYCIVGLEAGSGATSLVDYTYEWTESGETKTYTGKYPNTWFNNGNLNPDYKNAVQMCTFKMESELDPDTVPVLYAMSQATGYKHTSNKELPGERIPWLRYYFPRASYDAEKDSATANAEQKYPFYTIWTINNNTITGNVRKVFGTFNGSGKFDINLEYPYVKKGYSAVEKNWVTEIHSINGITSMSVADAEQDTRVISIKK